MVLIVTARLPCATAQEPSVTASFITTEPVRALSTTRAAGSQFHVQVLDVGQEGHALVGGGRMLHCTVRPSSALAVPAPLAVLMAMRHRARSRSRPR